MRFLLAVAAMLFSAAAAAQSPIPAGPAPVDAGPPPEVRRCPARPDCLPTFIARLKNAPYPLAADSDGEGGRFFAESRGDTGLRIRVNRHGDRYPEHIHYADPSVLFHVPPGFDPKEPFRLLVFFHGHETVLEPDLVGRMRLTRQVDASGANVILIAPQLARKAIDSHPGKLARQDGLARFLGEAERLLARATGVPRRRLAAAPIVLAAYSGGYLALAAGLEKGGVEDRVEGLVLLDAVFGRVDVIDAWLERRAGSVFLVGLYGMLSADWTIDLMYRWEARAQTYKVAFPKKIRRGTLVLRPVVTDHERIPTDGPPAAPLARILGLLDQS